MATVTIDVDWTGANELEERLNIPVDDSDVLPHKLVFLCSSCWQASSCLIASCQCFLAHRFQTLPFQLSPHAFRGIRTLVPWGMVMILFVILAEGFMSLLACRPLLFEGLLLCQLFLGGVVR